MKFRTLAIALALAAAGSAFAARTTQITTQLPDGTIRHTVQTDRGLHEGKVVRDLRRDDLGTGDLRHGHRIVNRTVVYHDGYRRHHYGHHHAHALRHSYRHHHRVRQLHRPVRLVRLS